MTPPPARRTHAFRESVIRGMSRLAAQHGAINLAQGFPNFPAPDLLKEAAARAIRDNINQYAITWGARRLREAVARKYHRWYDMPVDPEAEVTVTCGATEAIYSAIQGLIDPGDEVILIEPFYDSYVPAVQMAGGVPRYVTLHPPLAGESAWRLDLDELNAAFNARTRVIVINTPHNPTGKVFTAEELKAMIAKGTVSYELRTFLIHPQDVPASLLARCNGAGPFFAIAEQMFATQNDWLSRSSSITAADQQSWATMTPNQVAASMADKLGLVEFVQQRGIPAEKAQACLADAQGIKTLEKIAKVATEDFKITGTPTFIINGQIVPNVTTWADLAPELKKAGG